VRMQPRTGEYPLMLLSHFQPAIICPWPGPAPDGQNPFQTRFTSARQHVSAISGKLFTFNVGVGINIQRESSLHYANRRLRINDYAT
jgi:hypothetical protein